MAELKIGTVFKLCFLGGDTNELKSCNCFRVPVDRFFPHFMSLYFCMFAFFFVFLALFAKTFGDNARCSAPPRPSSMRDYIVTQTRKGLREKSYSISFRVFAFL